MKRPIHFKLMRGGSSKGLFLYGAALSDDPATRNKELIEIMGSNTLLQVGGLGGGHPTTNKVCLVYQSTRKHVDLEYLICQVSPDKPEVDDSIDCGNMLAAVGPFALEEGLIKANSPKTTVRIYSRNTKTLIESEVETPDGLVNYEGNTNIDGVGSGAPIHLTIFNPGGTTTGKLFPTGNLIDSVGGILITCIDASMPLIIVAAESLGKTGTESKAALDQDKVFMQKMDELRKAGIKLMNLPSTDNKAVAKICMIGKPMRDGNISARYIISPGSCDCHPTFAVTGAISLSAAASIQGTLASRYVVLADPAKDQPIKIEHPSGMIEARINFENNNKQQITSASYIRTAQLIASGKTFLADASTNDMHVLSKVTNLFKKPNVKNNTQTANPKEELIAAFDAGKYEEAISTILRVMQVKGIALKS